MKCRFRNFSQSQPYAESNSVRAGRVCWNVVIFVNWFVFVCLLPWYAGEALNVFSTHTKTNTRKWVSSNRFQGAMCASQNSAAVSDRVWSPFYVNWRNAGLCQPLSKFRTITRCMTELQSLGYQKLSFKSTLDTWDGCNKVTREPMCMGF